MANFTSYSAPALPLVNTTSMSINKTGNYNFAINLANQLSQTDENLFFSPASISFAMFMCFIGAKSTTKNQIGDTVYGTHHHDDAAKIVLGLALVGNKSNYEYQISFANRAYADKKYKIMSNYQTVMTRDIGSPLISVDFAANKASLVDEMNQWVASKTNNKIQNMIRPDMLKSNTALFLLNALYVKGFWDFSFSEENTKKEDFFCNPQSTVKVDMMKMKRSTGYFENDQVKVLQLTLRSSSTSMIIMLPKERFGLSSVMQSLNGEKLMQFWTNLGHPSVQISLPKFKIERSFNLNDALKKVGIVDAFNETTADFSEMVDPTSARVRVTDVVHKAFIEVNENGTEATAATFVKIVPAMFSPHQIQVETKSFVADHPFLFLLIGGPSESRSILFLGQYYGK